MSKLSFRARALDAGKPMPIYMAEELPDLPDYSAINRAVPQMPSGMQKEEECEHHLQRAICAGLIIPTPEVADVPLKDFYDKVYPANYKQPRQLIHMQPFTMEQDIPDYDMDSDDERWLLAQTQKLDLTPLKFEEMMDILEKSSGQTVVTLNEAKALLKEDDDLIIAVFDYWLNKRLKTQHPLIPTVKTEHRSGTAANNPYLAFRRRTEKMQTRKNRKNDEVSYEKMLKLRRDLYRAVTLLELVKRREKTKREYVHLSIEVFEKRFQAKDFSGAIMAEASAAKATQRPAFTPIFHNHYPNQSWSNKAALKDEVIPRREKRQYKRRKHKSLSHRGGASTGLDSAMGISSDEESTTAPQAAPEVEEAEDEGYFAFRRNKLCSYHMPLPQTSNWPWCSKEEGGLGDKRFRFTLTSLSNNRCVGFARRRMGRGGRVILDRVATDYDDLWRTLDFSIIEPKKDEAATKTADEDTLLRIKEEPVLRTADAFKSESAVVRTTSECVGGNEISEFSFKVECKTEPMEVFENDGVSRLTETPPPPTLAQDVGQVCGESKEDKDDMVEFLRSLRRDWLHFRPKTPPPDFEQPCHLLPPSPTSLMDISPSASFSMEVQHLDVPSATLLDSSPFVSDAFSFDLEPVVADTRHQQHDYATETDDCDWRTVGCSRFTLSDAVGGSGVGAWPTADSAHPPSLQLDCGQTTTWQQRRSASGGSSSGVTWVDGASSANSMKERRCSGGIDASSMVNSGNTNGLLTQFGFDVSPNNRAKNNKLATYAYNSTGLNYPNVTSGTLSLHTSAHTLTLNSHSANLLEIPMNNDADGMTSKLVNSHGTGDNGSGGAGTPNNKTKTIVRKNNLIMEVT